MDTPPDDLDPAAFRAFLQAQNPGEETLAETRARMDLRGLATPLPAGCGLAETTFGGVAGERLTPRTARPGRRMLYLHGGGYQLGSPRSIRHFAARLAEAAAVEALVPEYRLAPEHPFPAAVEDALATYRAALEEAASERIVLAGDSAGAGLALGMLVAARQAGLPMPAAAYLISPWCDLDGGGASIAAKAESDIFVSLAGLKAMAAAYATADQMRDPRAAPLCADFAGFPPLLIHVGSEEILLSDSTRLAERAGLAEVEVRLEVEPEMLHGFPIFHDKLSAARRAIAEAGTWLRGKVA
jgi:acetyl esterase/lipase